MIPRLLTIPEVSEITGLALSTFHDMDIRRRLGLPAVRFGKRTLFRLEDVEALVQRNLERFEEAPSVE